MIEIHKNFFSNSESDNLIDYYNKNMESSYMIRDSVYSFDAVDIINKKEFSFFDKLVIETPLFIRIQKINSNIDHVDKMHRHKTSWTCVGFLNDNYIGGDLIIENVTITPEKNTLVIFHGDLKHMVSKVLSGDRYTIVSFSDNKIVAKKPII